MAISVVSQTKLRNTSSVNPQGVPSAVTAPASSLMLMAVHIGGINPVSSPVSTDVKPLNFAGGTWTRLSHRTGDTQTFGYLAWYYLEISVGSSDVPDYTIGAVSAGSATAGHLIILTGAQTPTFLDVAGNQIADTGQTVSGTFTPTTTGSVLCGQFLQSGAQSSEAGTTTINQPATVASPTLWTDRDDFFAGGGGMFVKSGTNTASVGVSWSFSDAGSTAGSSDYSWSYHFVEVKPSSGVTPVPFIGWGQPV